MLASFTRHGITRDELFSESILQTLASSDTTATALRAIMLHLITHPPVYRRLQAETDGVVASGVVPATPNIISDAYAKNMSYLQAVIREGLCIHPPVTDILPKVVPKGGGTITIDGERVFLPGGANAGYCAWGVHRNKGIFGEEADQFRPERWLRVDGKKNGEQLTAMRRTTEIIFAYGKYQCLGKPIAWMEITKVVFEFFRHFDWSLATPGKPWRQTNYLGIFGCDRVGSSSH